MKDDSVVDGTRALDLARIAIGALPGGGIVSALVDLIPHVHGMRVQVMLAGLIDLLGDSESGLVARMQSDERVQRLLFDAVQAAWQSDTSAKLHALSTVASRGVIDDAALDESRYKIEVLRELQVIDVRLLVHLEGLPDEQNASTADLLGVSIGVAHGLNAKLIRLALANTGGMTFGANYSAVHITPFGRDVLANLRESGDGDPVT